MDRSVEVKKRPDGCILGIMWQARDCLGRVIKNYLFYRRCAIYKSVILFNWREKLALRVRAFLKLARGGTLSWSLAAALLGTICRGWSAPSIVYVDATYRTNGSIVTFPNVGGAGSYRVGSNAFNTIQAAVTNVSASGTVYVAAGTYVENVPVCKAVSLA